MIRQTALYKNMAYQKWQLTNYAMEDFLPKKKIQNMNDNNNDLNLCEQVENLKNIVLLKNMS